MPTLDETFREATVIVKRAEPTDADKLKLYALFKAQTGSPLGARPGGLFNLVDQAKWDARKALGHCSVENAKRRYICLVKKLCPEWTDDGGFGGEGDEGQESSVEESEDENHEESVDQNYREQDRVEDEESLPIREVDQSLFNQSLTFYKQNRTAIDGALLPDEVLELYSCYKVITVGACTSPVSESKG